jgi:hypothetical protein
MSQDQTSYRPGWEYSKLVLGLFLVIAPIALIVAVVISFQSGDPRRGTWSPSCTSTTTSSPANLWRPCPLNATS